MGKNVDKSVKDRRRMPRVDGSFDARIVTGAAPIEARVKNVSMSGLLLTTSQKVEEMTIVSMKLVLPATHDARGAAYAFDLTGAVVRCEGTGRGKSRRYELAVFFTEMPAETRSALEHFVRNRLG